MTEYRIEISGKCSLIVISPKIIGTLISKIRCSSVRELAVPAEEVLPREYAEYLTCVLRANAEIAEIVPNRNLYELIAGQIEQLRCNEQTCFDRVKVTGHESNPWFDLDASEDFYIAARQEDNCFRYIFKGGNNEEIRSSAGAASDSRRTDRGAGVCVGKCQMEKEKE